MDKTGALAGDDEFITIARVRKTQGRHGEVAAQLFTDFPEKFAERKRLFAVGKTGERKEMKVENHWPHKGWMVFKFAGVDSMDAAELLIGCELQIPVAERAQLEQGTAYVSDLVGCAVFDFAASPDPVEVGTIKEVEFGSGEAPTLIVLGSAGDEYMIPFAERYVRKLDLAAKRLDMQLPDGLLEVHKPLRAEKKERKPRVARGRSSEALRSPKKASGETRSER